MTVEEILSKTKLEIRIIYYSEIKVSRNCNYCNNCDCCYNCYNCDSCNNCYNCDSCNNCDCCYNCYNCDFCYNQRNQKFMVLNVQLTEEQYKQYKEKQ